MDNGLIGQFANIFNTGGGYNTIVWLSVLLLTVIVYAVTDLKQLKPTLIAAVICFFVSFTKLELAYQAVIFAVIVVAGTYMTAKLDKQKTDKGNQNK